MPLIILVGIPQTGKTRTSIRIKEYFESKSVNVVLINEEALGIEKITAYSSNSQEKNLRAALKSNVERSLDCNTVVILDSLNYIKGYRYELFCIVRQTKTTQCVIYLDIPKTIACTWNTVYPSELFDDLSNRIEIPTQKNKWDSPLIILRPDEEIPFEQIFETVVHGRNLTENMATIKQPVLEQDYLHLVDQATHQTVEFILKAQEDYPEGCEVPVPLTQSFYTYQNKLSALQLKKLKQQFLKINKTKPGPVQKISENFIAYINSSFE